MVGREKVVSTDPFGTLFIPMEVTMGPDDEDAPMSHTTKSVMVSTGLLH